MIIENVKLKRTTFKNLLLLIKSPLLGVCYTVTLMIWLLTLPLKLTTISLYVSLKNLVLDKVINFYLISLSILLACLVDNAWIL